MAALSRILCFSAVLACASFASSAGAADACEESTASWIKRCAERARLSLVLRACPTNRLVIGVPDADIDVELSTGEVPAFHRVGAIGVSPVGDFPRWAEDSEKQRREAFDAIEGCVRADGAVPFVRGQPTMRSTIARPWLLLAGSMLGLVLAFLRVKRARTFALGLAAFLASTLLVLFTRKLLLPFAFFHQNGIGPSWVDTALGGTPRASEYGPGFAELFGFAVRAAGSHPEQGIFWLGALLGAVIPAIAFLGARALGASRAVGLAVFVGLWFDPILARIAQSESYFASIVALLMGASLALTAATGRANPKSWTFALGVLSAGLLIAQAARVHPIGWIPAALIPLVVLLGPGPLKRRAIAAAIAGLGIASVVLVTTGPSLFAIVRGSLGHQWMSQAGPRWHSLEDAVPLLLVALFIAWSAGGRRGIVLGVVAAASLAIGAVTDILNQPNPAVDAAFDRLMLPVLVPVVAVWVDRLSRRRRWARARLAPVALGAMALVGDAANWSRLTRLPTDAREAAFALEWRERLEPGAEVVYVERAGIRTMRLPLYDGVTAASRRAVVVGEPVPDLSKLAGNVYYYRSSTCVTEDAQATCKALEASAPLELVAERALPAIASMRWSPFPVQSLTVALYRRR